MVKWLALIVLICAGQAQANSIRNPFFNFDTSAERFGFVDLIPPGQGGVRYTCRFPYDPDKGWVPERLTLSLGGTGRSLVSDGVIARYHDNARQTTVRQRANGNLIMRWSVFSVRDKGGKITPYLGYELQIDPDTGAAAMVVRPKNFSTRFRADGRCARGG